MFIQVPFCLGRRIIAETTLSSLEKQVNSTVARHVTLIYADKPTSAVHGNDQTSLPKRSGWCLS